MIAIVSFRGRPVLGDMHSGNKDLSSMSGRDVEVIAVDDEPSPTLP